MNDELMIVGGDVRCVGYEGVIARMKWANSFDLKLFVESSEKR